MPELPEIETLRLQLSQKLTGLTIRNIEILKQKSFIGDPGYVTGEKITGIRRCAKILVIDLSNGLSLAVHLKMSGQLIFRNQKSEIRNQNEHKEGNTLLNGLPNKHTRVIIRFTDGSRLFFNDMRMFGWMRICENPKSQIPNPEKIQNSKFKIQNLDNYINKLGPDPLSELTEDRFYKILQSSVRPVKMVLMDQEKIAGVGNIYANECLFMSRINPKIKASRITRRKSDELLKNLVKVLKLGIEQGGASSNLFVNSYGEKGRMQEHLLVYGGKGGDCPNRCGRIIERIKLGGRGTFFCPMCQR